MTKLEALLKKLDQESDRQGEMFDPMPYLKAYLAKRNDAVSAILPVDQAIAATAYANSFDNGEVAPDWADNLEVN